MKIYFMKQKALDSLQAEVADNLNKYQSSSFWMDEHFIKDHSSAAIGLHHSLHILLP